MSCSIDVQAEGGGKSDPSLPGRKMHLGGITVTWVNLNTKPWKYMIWLVVWNIFFHRLGIVYNFFRDSTWFVFPWK